MFNFIIKLFANKSDELVGIWQTTNEGGFHIMMGSELIFNADGTGSEYSWGSNGDGDPYEFKNEIVWLRK